MGKTQETSVLEKAVINTLQQEDEVTVGEFRLKLEIDEDSMNPLRECDGEPTFVCFHGRYDLGSDGHPYTPDMFEGWEGLERAIRRDHNVWVLKPLYMYDHSGITISTSPFSCPWDSGQIGFVFYGAKEVEKIFGWRRKSAKRLKQVEESLDASVETYDQYLRGEVYAYTIEDQDQDGEVVDSCGGFIGKEAAAESCVHDSDVNLELKEPELV